MNFYVITGKIIVLERINDLFFQMVGFIADILGIITACLSFYYMKRSREYKNEVYARLNDIDLSNSTERFMAIVSEVARMCNKPNNNKGGALLSQMDKVSDILLALPIIRIEETNVGIVAMQQELLKYVNNVKGNPTIDVPELVAKLNEFGLSLKRTVEVILNNNKY